MEAIKNKIIVELFKEEDGKYSLIGEEMLQPKKNYKRGKVVSVGVDVGCIQVGDIVDFIEGVHLEGDVYVLIEDNVLRLN